MGERYLVDSNVLIDYTSGRLPQRGSDFAEQIFDTDFLISVAVKIEVLGFGDIPSNLAFMEEFIDTAKVLPLNDATTNQTILLRRKYRKLKLGDAIIAATAITNNLVLITHNTSDFKQIEGLSTINLWNM